MRPASCTPTSTSLHYWLWIAPYISGDDVGFPDKIKYFYLLNIATLRKGQLRIINSQRSQQLRDGSAKGILAGHQNSVNHNLWPWKGSKPSIYRTEMVGWSVMSWETMMNSSHLEAAMGPRKPGQSWHPVVFAHLTDSISQRMQPKSRTYSLSECRKKPTGQNQPKHH